MFALKFNTPEFDRKRYVLLFFVDIFLTKQLTYTFVQSGIKWILFYLLEFCFPLVLLMWSQWWPIIKHSGCYWFANDYPLGSITYWTSKVIFSIIYNRISRLLIFWFIRSFRMVSYSGMEQMNQIKFFFSKIFFTPSLTEIRNLTLFSIEWM